MSTTTQITGTFAKFEDEWLARIPLNPEPAVGETITLIKRNGARKEVVFNGQTNMTDDEHRLVSFQDSTPRPARTRQGGRRPYGTRPAAHGRCAGCGGALTSFDVKASAVVGFHFDCA